jgi:hypothetical protein
MIKSTLLPTGYNKLLLTVYTTDNVPARRVEIFDLASATARCQCYKTFFLSLYSRISYSMYVHPDGKPFQPGASSIKHYGHVIYGKWTDFVVSYCLSYC